MSAQNVLRRCASADFAASLGQYGAGEDRNAIMRFPVAPPGAVIVFVKFSEADRARHWSSQDGVAEEGRAILARRLTVNPKSTGRCFRRDFLYFRIYDSKTAPPVG
jgi:hypothetical protein